MITAARWISLIAAFVMGAVAEYRLAVMLGYDKYTAGLLPLVLDVYGFAAFKVRNRVHSAAAMLAMFAVQMVSHLMTMGHGNYVHVVLSIGLSAIAPAVSFACHRLGETPEADMPEVFAELPAEAFAPVLMPEPVHPIVEPIPAEVFAATPADIREQLARLDAEAAKRVIPGEDDEQDAPEDADASPSMAETAARARELLPAHGNNKTKVAREMGISRTWLYTCLRETPA
ncbi:hypothetical protein BKA00_007455 [Actinomadura coerulea]|uniref:Uncharacterized protein n=1 Tax=Actinomadura coerulea TaxID=46159 RepID=A0A7X0G917_9ACTN|nr:hypothetical protein [Actinomadura coerulea]MBB6400541.1 hypothetical protein [Actinomadura coerulea]GGQ07983.1 hypothetical protein GCM10010187_25100 [Actinomadura coerulea]